MVCPKCKFENFQDADSCLVCGTALTRPTATSPDLYEGFVPAWLQPKPNPAELADPATNTVNTVSIEEPLNRTTSVFKPLADPATTATNAISFESVRPGFQIMPTPNYTSNFRDETPPSSPFSNTFTAAPPPYYDPRTEQNPSAGNGVYKGCYWFQKI